MPMRTGEASGRRQFACRRCHDLVYRSSQESRKVLNTGWSRGTWKQLRAPETTNAARVTRRVVILPNRCGNVEHGADTGSFHASLKRPDLILNSMLDVEAFSDDPPLDKSSDNPTACLRNHPSRHRRSGFRRRRRWGHDAITPCEDDRYLSALQSNQNPSLSRREVRFPMRCFDPIQLSPRSSLLRTRSRRRWRCSLGK